MPNFQRCCMGGPVPRHRWISRGQRILQAHLDREICVANSWSRAGEKHANRHTLLQLDVHIDGDFQVSRAARAIALTHLPNKPRFQHLNMHDGRHGTIKALAWTFGQHQRCHGDCSSFWTRHVFRCRVHWYQSSRAVFNDRWVQNFICLVFTTRSDNCLGRVSCKSEKNANSIASTQQQHRIKRCRRALFFSLIMPRYVCVHLRFYHLFSSFSCVSCTLYESIAIWGRFWRRFAR